MSKAEFDSDGFQIVKCKRLSKNKQTKIPGRQINYIKEEYHIDIDKATKRIDSAVYELKDSDYYTKLSKSVSTVLQSRKVVDIVCFGLGHVAECKTSCYQLGLLLCLKDLCSPNKVLVHDPVFYKDECEVLKRFGLELIEENCEGSYVISEHGVTLVYLPHCPKQLTNNFLWSNWGTNIANCILICNSFSSLFDNHPSRIVQSTVPFIHKIFSCTNEIILDNTFKFTDIFNDTSIHYFPKESLEKLEPHFWDKGEKPSYENTEEFITSLMIEKLNI